MLQFLYLSILLLLTLTVSGKDLQCRQLHPIPRSSCWSSHLNTNCFCCTIKSEQIADELLTIHHKSANGAGIVMVRFDGGDVSKLPKIMQKSTKRAILRVELLRTNTRVLNANFFGNFSQNMTHFSSYWNALTVEVSAFQNCPNLENLELKIDGNDSIAPDAFLGLHKLKSLRLMRDKMTQINENWFMDLENLEVLDLGGNELEDILDLAFNKLHKLKKLLLNDNKIKIIRKKLFQNNQKLQEIHLERNQIKIIHWGTFKHLKLKKLDLRGNKCLDENFDDETSSGIAEGLTVCHSPICVIPHIPNGFVINAKDNVPQTPGDSLEHLDSVKVYCQHSFLLFHKKDTLLGNKCTRQGWTNQKWPICES